MAERKWLMERFFGLEEKTISVCRELIPVGKTRQNIDKYSAMTDDELIYKNNHLIKDLIKKMALEKIEGALDGIKSELDFSELFAYNHGTQESFYVSPVSHATIKDNDCREMVQCINMYKTATNLTEKYCG